MSTRSQSNEQRAEEWAAKAAAALDQHPDPGAAATLALVYELRALRDALAGELGSALVDEMSELRQGLVGRTSIAHGGVRNIYDAIMKASGKR